MDLLKMTPQRARRSRQRGFRKASGQHADDDLNEKASQGVGGQELRIKESSNPEIPINAAHGWQVKLKAVGTFSRCAAWLKPRAGPCDHTAKINSSS